MGYPLYKGGEKRDSYAFSGYSSGKRGRIDGIHRMNRIGRIGGMDGAVRMGMGGVAA